MTTTKKSMKAVFDCSADEPGELSFKEGDILVDVEESGEEGWYTGRIQNTSEIGLFPYNYVVELPQKGVQEKSLSRFPPIDAFEAAMSSGKTNSNWTSSTINSHIGTKPKMTPNNNNITNSSNVGLGIKLYTSNNNNNSSSSTFEKPQLKPVGGIKSVDTSPTRSRSYSTSAVLMNTFETKEPLNTEKTLRPSQLLNGKGTKSALEIALSKGSPNSPLSPNIKSTSAFLKNNSNTSGIALPGMSNTKLKGNNNNIDMEEEEGFQMIKPSQLRQRQQQSPNITTPIRPIVSQSYAPTTITPSWKKTSNNKANHTGDKASPLPSTRLKSSASKLDAAPSSTPMPRLPSRPVSTASRKSRNSRNSSLSSNNTTKVSLPPVREATITTAAIPSPSATATEKPIPPPILKPKPQITPTTNSQPNLPPRPKLRSTSNPPPIQPKPAMSSIEILLSKNINNNNNNKKSETVSGTTTTASSFSSPSFSSKFSTSPPLPRNAASKPVISTTKPNFTPSKLSTKTNLDDWQSPESTKQDVNIKPSTLLKNNRARSATNPVSYSSSFLTTSSTSPPDWMTALKSKPATTTKPVLYERPASPIAHPVSRSPAPIATSSTTATPVATAVIEPAKKKTAPPPPPPSRPPKSLNQNTASSKSSSLDNSKQRYEILFDTIHDDGYVDGETAHFLWLKSKLSNEDLAKIWKECDPDHKGLLDKHAFIDGMSKIDELLSLKQQQQQQIVQ